MNFVQPIRDKSKIEEIKTELLKSGYRDYLLFVTGINTGLRISDLIKLKVKDVKNLTHIVITEQKTGKTKRFLINSYLKEKLDLIIKCFCAEVPVSKTSKICNLSDDIVATFSTYFRKTIYEKQLKELDSNFKKKPQQFRLRKFYDKIAYFYFYNEKLFVTESPLPSAKECKSFKPTEIKKFKILYCRIKRILNQNTRRILPHHHIAECLWRDSKSFDELVYNLNQLLSGF